MSAFLLGLIIIGIVFFSFLLGVILSNAEPNEILIILCLAIISLITIFGITYTDTQNKRLEKYGTYPDTTITIKNGVRDTSITYKVYEEKNN